MENFLLIIVLGVLLLYFFSSSNVYKSLYKKVNEEKNIIQEEIVKFESLIDRYEKQVKISANTLKNKLDELQKRNEELYAQVNAMV